jgi:flagellar M-ring protein FliF
LQKTIGKELQENVRKTLAPYLGLGNFEISVAARLNLDKRQSSETTFDPETKVERSLRTIKETGSSTNMNGKPVVTVEQNIPADPAATKSGDESRRSSERKETLSNYEVSSRTIQTTSEGYRSTLTVAVVVNRKRLVETLGSKATPEAIDAAMKEVERLVGTATGLDNKRGDRLTVAAVDFLPGNQILEPVPGPSLVEQLLRHTGSFVTAAAMLGATFLLIWLGVRPATKALLQATPEAAAIDDGPLGGMAMAGLPGMMMAPEPLPTLPMPPEEETSLIADLASRAGLSPQKRLEQVIEFSEEQAAAILKQWMREA